MPFADAGRPRRWSRALPLPLAVLLALHAAACGGGGTGGSEGGGSSAPNGNYVSLDTPSVSLVSTGGLSDPSQKVTAHFQGAGVAVGTPPGQSKPPWLSVTAQALSSTAAQITISGSPYQLAPGRYSCVVRVATADADGSNVAYQDLPVSLTVPQTVSPTSLVVSLIAVGGASATRTLTLAGGDIAWEATASAPWLELGATSGTGPASLALDIDASGLPPGDYSGTVTIRDTFTHLTQTVSVTLGVDPHRLVVADRSVGLFAIGAKARLSRTLAVTDNAHVPTAWTASSDRTWLALGAVAGTTDDALTVTADPDGLATGMHYARVTLAPASAGDGTQPVTVRVGLYVDAGGVAVDAPVVHVTIGSVYPGYPDLVADPIRPFFYFTGVGEQIAVYNGQTGTLDGSITVAGAKLAAMAVSADGAKLYVEDSGSGAIYPVDLETRTVGAALTVARFADAIAWSLVDGREVIFTSGCQAIDAGTGDVLADVLATSGVSYPSAVAAAPDGHAVFVQGGTLGNHGLARFETSARNGNLVMTRTQSFNEPGDGRGLVVGFASTRLFTESPWHVTSGPTWDGNVYDARTLTLVTHLVEPGRNYTPAADGSLVYSNTDVGGSDTTIRSYAPDLSPAAGEVQVVGTVGSMRLSGDDHRLAVFGSGGYADSRITFVDRP